MAVIIRYVNLRLVWVNSMGEVIEKDSNTTTLADIKSAVSQEVRVMDNTTGHSPAPNSINNPTVAQYLELEAADGAGWAFAYMDQTQLITQQIS